jgi:hypothetical protein
MIAPDGHSEESMSTAIIPVIALGGLTLLVGAVAIWATFDDEPEQTQPDTSEEAHVDKGQWSQAA